jgi:hypothetical protein
MTRYIRPVALALIAASLQACAADSAAYPSLAKRDAERVSGSAPVVTPDSAIMPPPSPALANRLDQSIAQARAAHGRFAAREARARQLAQSARGAAIASESWAVATIALADLESARSDVMIVLADLDAAYAQAKVEGGDSTAIEQARATVTALVSNEDRVLAELRGLLAS